MQPPERYKQQIAVRNPVLHCSGWMRYINTSLVCSEDICGGEKNQTRQLKSIALNGLHPSRENWLESWLMKRRLWGLEAFSLQFENLYCVKLFNTYYSIHFKVDNHH